MMNYGVTRVNSKVELTSLKGKRIPDINVYNVNQIDVLINKLSKGDVVYVVSVMVFPSVWMFLMFADAVLSSGGVLHVISEPYLDVGNGKYYRPSVRTHLETLVKLERENTARMFKGFNLSLDGRCFVGRCITDITLGILATTYADDGILHRGS